MCQHAPTCPPADAIDREAARLLVSHPEQGWSLLCNGVIMFEDTGELLPDGTCIEPHRGPAPHAPSRTPAPSAPPHSTGWHALAA
ncbi:MAG TPA: DUF5999 family protein [Pilimelia sp.]|nr:DUF5999 family protein [Pilimelia sp.]